MTMGWPEGFFPYGESPSIERLGLGILPLRLIKER
jgi:hypothetical protein